MNSPLVDPGFRPGKEGLVIPSTLERPTQKWTPEEWKLFNRCAKLLREKGLTMPIECASPECKGAQLMPQRLKDGSFQLQCHCTTRVLAKVLGSQKRQIWQRRRSS